jgi:hypothetical protein
MWLALAPVFVTAAAPRVRRLIRQTVPRVPIALGLAPTLALAVVAWNNGDFRAVKRQCFLTGIRGPYGVALGPVAPYDATVRFQRHVKALGFQGTTIAIDTCSGTAVVTPLLGSLAVAQSVAAEAQSAHLVPRIVLGSG